MLCAPKVPVFLEITALRARTFGGIKDVPVDLSQIIQWKCGLCHLRSYFKMQ